MMPAEHSPGCRDCARCEAIQAMRQLMIASLTPRQRIARWWAWWGPQTVVAVLVVAAFVGLCFWLAS